ncbi:MAG: carbohydrate ABC transporter substrate-binding protein, partial [Oscillospiraceae bacterium]|nr:carbohydrate ABC transporter substrate-binding protein [Oscillospiraceae bacterium]
MKRTLAFILMIAMIMALSVSGTAFAAKDVTLTIFNSKMEIQSQLEEMADEYMDSHKGVEVEVYYSSDTV